MRYMEPDLSRYQLEGDNSMYRLPSGLVAPVVMAMIGALAIGAVPGCGRAVDAAPLRSC